MNNYPFKSDDCTAAFFFFLAIEFQGKTAKVEVKTQDKPSTKQH